MPSLVLQRALKGTYLQVLSLNFVRYFSSKHKNVIASAYEDVEIPNVTIPQYIFQNFHRFPKKIAVECSTTGRKYTFEEIRRKSHNLSRGLRKILKLNDGDVLAILLPNIPEYPICVLGTLEANLIVTCINPTFTPGEIKNQLIDSNAKAVITLSTLCPLLDVVFDGMKRQLPIINVKCSHLEILPQNVINFNELADNRFDIKEHLQSSINDTALLLYSSGTTGLPKGVTLSHRNLISNLCQIDHPAFKICHETTDNHQDIIAGILPWFHIAGLNPAMFLYLRYLCKLVSLPKFTPEIFLNMLVNHKPHLLPVVPSVVLFMANHPLVKKEYLQNVRSIICGAAPLGPLDEEKILKKTENNIQMLQAYGLTEASPFITATSFIKQKDITLKGSIGEILPNTSAKVVPVDDPRGDALGPNESGELLVKGPQVTAGYHNRPEETDTAFLDGWLRTGDLVYYDESKMFYVQDRIKELIKVKGYQVAPAELESMIRNYPGVEDAAVIGVLDERYGEVPRAFVVLKSGAQLNINNLKKFVSDNVVEYKTLKGGVVIVNSIPKNASGKILRRQLKLRCD